MSKKSIFKILLFVYLGLLNVAKAQQDPVLPDEAFNCQSDEDCIFVAGSCCGDTMAVNRKFKPKWEKDLNKVCLSYERSASCPAVIDEVPYTTIPSCQQKKCIANPIPDYSKKDQKFCANLKGESEKNACYWDVAIGKMDSNICFEINDKSEFVQSRQETSQRCLSETKRLFLQKGPINDKVCSEVLETNAKDRCFERLAEQKKDFNFCLKISDPMNRLGCAGQFVDIERSVDQCNPILKQDNSYTFDMMRVCITTVALKRNDVDACNKYIEIETSKYSNHGPWFACVTEVAKASKKTKICEKLRKRSKPKDFKVPGFDEADCKKQVKQVL